MKGLCRGRVATRAFLILVQFLTHYTYHSMVIFLVCSILIYEQALEYSAKENKEKTRQWSCDIAGSSRFAESVD